MACSIEAGMPVKQMGVELIAKSSWKYWNITGNGEGRYQKYCERAIISRLSVLNIYNPNSYNSRSEQVSKKHNNKVSYQTTIPNRHHSLQPLQMTFREDWQEFGL